MARGRATKNAYNLASTADLRSWVEQRSLDSHQLEQIQIALTRRKSRSARLLQNEVESRINSLSKKKISGTSKQTVNPRRAGPTSRGTKCSAITKTGSRCRNTIRDLSESSVEAYCSLHDSSARCLGTTGSTRSAQCMETVKSVEFTDGKPYCRNHKSQLERSPKTETNSKPQMTQDPTKTDIHSTSSDSSIWLKNDDDRVQFATDQVEQLRRVLLEGISRGNFLDMKHGMRAKNHIRVVNNSLDVVYSHLMESGARCSFRGLEDPPDNPADETTRSFESAFDAAFESDQSYLDDIEMLDEEDENDQIKFSIAERNLRDRLRASLGMPERMRLGVNSAIEIARSQGIDPSYELRATSTTRTTRTLALQTLDFERELSAKMAGVRQGANRAVQESGNNSLHAVFAFLEWYPERRPDRRMLSPLVLAPVEHDTNAWKNRRQLVISSQGDAAMVNPALKVRLLDDEHLTLPDFDPVESYSTFLSKVEGKIENRPRWKVRRFLTFGLFESSLIELWNDLNTAKWPADRDPSRHKSVATLLAGGSDRAGFTGEEYEIDSPEIATRLPEPILDADSSQLSAIIDVLDGHDLAIEGPPGTGKSQTIANMIAALMQSGKSVLFVAEKMAALDVVKSRLDNVGLGDYVLELHSTKARRSNVYNSFKESLGRTRQYEAYPKYREQVGRLKNLKQQLNTYVADMNSDLGSTGLTVHKALWKINTLGGHALPLSLRAARIDNAQSIDPLKREFIVESLNQFEELEGDVINEFDGMQNHPWSWVNEELSMIDREGLVKAIDDLGKTLNSLDRYISDLTWSGLTNGSHADIDDLANSLSALLELPSEIPPGVSSVFLDSLSADTSVEAIRSIRDFIRMIFESAKFLDSISIDNHVDLELSELEKINAALSIGSSKSVSDLEPKLAEITMRLADFQSLENVLKNVLTESQIDIDHTRENATLLTTGLVALKNCPPISLSLRSEKLLEPGALDLIARRRGQIAEALDNFSNTSQVIDGRRLPDVTQLDQHISDLVSGGVFSFLKPSVKRARNFWKTITGIPKLPSDVVIIDDFMLVHDLIKLDQEIESDGDFKALAGNTFDGLYTDFNNLSAAADLMTSSSKIVGADIDAARRIRELVRTSSADQITRLLTLFGEHIETAPELLKHCSSDHVIAQEVEHLENLQKTVSSGIDASISCGVIPNASNSQITEAIAAVNRSTLARAAIAQHEEIVEKLEAANVSLSEPSEIEVTLDMIDQIANAESRSWQGLFSAITKSNTSNEIRLLHDQSEKALTTLETFRSHSKSITALVGATESEGPPSWNTIQAGTQGTKASLDAIPSLARWIRFLESKRRATAPETVALWTNRDALDESHKLGSVWEGIYWRSAVDTAKGKLPSLNDGTGLTLGRARERLGEIDGEIQELAQKIVASEIAKNRIPAGVNVGSVRGKTERGLIDHVKDQSRSTVSVRDFVHRAGGAAKAYKPCWMMSPSSVARYLPRGGDLFDVIIMDEASQIRAEEAAGTLARARQAVIVGDTKQLPPTGFFRRGTNDDDWVEEKAESILEKANQQFPQRRLLWHYRSQHQDLIKFSNKFFYDNQLIVFPSADDSASNGMGVFFEHVPDALYQSRSMGRGTGGINPEQARIVAEKSIQAMIDRPDWSLGVAAVNRAQADLIESEIYRLTQTFSKANRFINDREGTLEPFFVKNLENVQGDERDHIIISTVYGPTTPGGKTMARFGPIGGEYGHRRLNVLFTRARRRVDVVSSMAAVDVVASENASDGVKALKGYLGFAATGNLEGTSAVPRGVPESDFEISVGEALIAAGYDIHFQVGVAGYRIDIGLRHKQYPHGYLLGIECDGAMYHSARSARDRDLLRQNQLESLGWTIYRIWSTDWFEDPVGEMKKLLEYLEERKSTASAEFEHRQLPTESLEITEIEEFDPPETSEHDDHISPALPEFHDPVDKVVFKPESEIQSAPLESRQSGNRSNSTHQIDSTNYDNNIDFSADWSSLGTEFAELPIDSTDPVEWVTFEHHPDEESDEDLQNVLMAQVEMYGPAHHSFIAKKLRDAYKFQKMGSHTEQRMLRLLRESVSYGDLVEYVDFFDLPDQLPWGPERLPRVAQDRSIEQIHNSELTAACRQVAISGNIVDTEELLRLVSKSLGYERIGRVIRERLGSIAEDSITRILVDSQNMRLQSNPLPEIFENSLVRLGYDPTLEPAQRWMFLQSNAIPNLTKEGVINTLQALIDSLESDPDTSKSIIGNMIVDMAQLRRFVGNVQEGVRRTDVHSSESSSSTNQESSESEYKRRLAEIKQKSPNAYEPWTNDQDEQLRTMFMRQTKNKRIAEVFGRQESAIRARLKKLGLD
jgi:very-short-patch-repair endonuclease